MNKVDLGLSVLWCECNLGADNVESPGRLFTWYDAVKEINGLDLAGQKLGKGWRLPTYAEVEELLCNRFKPLFLPISHSYTIWLSSLRKVMIRQGMM